MIVLLPAVLLAGAWRLQGTSAIEDDLLYYLPIRQYVGEWLTQGMLPRWNPQVAMGTTVAADPQAGLWYPPTLLFAGFPARYAYPLTLIAHFALAGAGMYRFLRSCRYDRAAALLGALAFEFSGYLVAHRAHLTIHHSAAWLPWMLWAWQRLVATSDRRYVWLGAAALGLQMLVQHIQISIICVTLVTAYVAFVLWPRRPALCWEYPLATLLGAAISAIQLIPTGLQYAGSIRSSPAFHLFVENSWWPSSVFLLFFPLGFGARTPNLWPQTWWGPSHFCEQSAYASLVILVLAAASWPLLTRAAAVETRRAVRFWWGASLVTLLIALGRFTPLSELLFHIPIYRSLRVPARWILVWSIAWPVLAAASVAAFHRDAGLRARLQGALRWTAQRALPATMALLLLLMILIRWQLPMLVDRLPAYWAVTIGSGVRGAVRVTNPALGWPILVAILTILALRHWRLRPTPRTFTVVLVVMLIDLGMIAATVDVDTRTYSADDLTRTPALARAIHERAPEPGHRLLVPRYTADYRRPLDVLWPQTNLPHNVETFNGYGPLWPLAHRLLLRFMPWGSCEDIVGLLHNTELCRALGLRFIAVRSDEEREMLAAALLPPIEHAVPSPPIKGAPDQWAAVNKGHDLRWPVVVEEPGLYALGFEARPEPGASGRWFVRLENADANALSRTRSIEPMDLAAGARSFRFVFYCPQRAEKAFVRLSSERGLAAWVRRARLSPVAHGNADPEQLPARPGKAARESFVFRQNLPGNISLYELPDARPLAWWAERIVRADDVIDVIAYWQNPTHPTTGRVTSVVEGAPAAKLETSVANPPPRFKWTTPDTLAVEVNAVAAGLLVINQSPVPGWQATLDGKPVQRYRVNAVAQGVHVPAGKHRIVLRYRPIGFSIGGAVTAVACLAWLLGWIRVRSASCCTDAP